MIPGGPDIFIHAGSPVTLECVISHFVIPPMSLNWTHNDKLLDKSRYSGLSHKVDTSIILSSNISMSAILTSFSSSVKIIVGMDKDSGNYTCWPDITAPATITLHVIDNRGEHRLPMLNSNALIVRQDRWIVIFLLMIIITYFTSTAYVEPEKSYPTEDINLLTIIIKQEQMIMC